MLGIAENFQELNTSCFSIFRKYITAATIFLFSTLCSTGSGIKTRTSFNGNLASHKTSFTKFFYCFIRDGTRFPPPPPTMAGETLIPSFLADILITQKRLWICTHLYSKYQLNPETHKSSNDQATWPK